MALEIPNVIAAAGVALITLESIVDEGTPTEQRAYGVELRSSVNLQSVEFPGGNKTFGGDESVPQFLQWELVNPVSPSQAAWSAGGSSITTFGTIAGPAPTLTGDPIIDALELGQVLVGMGGTVGDPDAVGSQAAVWLACWEAPLTGEVAA